jgi:hypothetical protein
LFDVRQGIIGIDQEQVTEPHGAAQLLLVLKRQPRDHDRVLLPLVLGEPRPNLVPIAVGPRRAGAAGAAVVPRAVGALHRKRGHAVDLVDRQRRVHDEHHPDLRAPVLLVVAADEGDTPAVGREPGSTVKPVAEGQLARCRVAIEQVEQEQV